MTEPTGLRDFNEYDNPQEWLDRFNNIDQERFISNANAGLFPDVTRLTLPNGQDVLWTGAIHQNNDLRVFSVGFVGSDGDTHTLSWQSFQQNPIEIDGWDLGQTKATYFGPDSTGEYVTKEIDIPQNETVQQEAFAIMEAVMEELRPVLLDAGVNAENIDRIEQAMEAQQGIEEPRSIIEASPDAPKL